MIIPLGHADQFARRWPWVSLGIILLSFFGWALLRTPMEAGELRVAVAQNSAVSFARAHPQTQVGACRALSDAKVTAGEVFVAPGVSLPVDLAGVRGLGQGPNSALAGDAADQAAADQATLARLCAAYEQQRGDSPKHRLGYVPGRSSWLTLISYQFVDDSFLHLVFGMWFLWLAGAVLEDGWGRVVYPLFYISGGICAAIFYKVAEPQSGVPLLGASGGVAAAVGAFLVRHPKAESRMLIWFRLRPRVITAPAFVMVGLWLGVELIGAMFYSLVESNAGAWAQFIGFGFGMLFAAGMRWTGAEKRLDAAIEQRAVEPGDPRLEQATRLLAEGQAAAALTRLQALTAEEPFNIDFQRALVEAAQRLADQPQLSAARAKLIELYQRRGDHEAAWQEYEQLSREGHGHSASRRARLRVAEHLAKTAREAQAMQELAALYAAGLHSPEAAEALVAHAELMLRLRQRDAALGLFAIAQRELGSYPRLSARISAGAAQAADASRYQVRSELAPGSAAGSAHGSAAGSAHGGAAGSAHGGAAGSAHGSAAGSAHGELPASLRDLPNPIKKLP